MPHFLIFLALYLTVYGGMHLYLYHQLRQGFVLEGRLRYGVMIFLLLMVVGPLLTRLLETQAGWQAARVWGVVAFGWMGMLVMAVALFLLVGLVRYAARLLHFFTHMALPRLAIGRQGVVIGVFAITLGAALYGYGAARQIHVERVTVATDKLPPGIAAYRMVQLSDIHLGVMTDEEWLSRLIETVNGLHPDLIVTTGDIIDSRVSSAEPFASTLKRLHARDGKFAVAGNHEFFAGIENSVAYMARCGFVMLRGEHAQVTPWLTLLGVDDREGRLTDGSGVDHEALLMEGVDSHAFNILLKHQPVVRETSLGRFDLQLAGHVHQGQIFPLRLFTWLVYPVPMGLSDLGRGSQLYVSRGAGTWGPPMRVMAPPEITLFEFVVAKSNRKKARH